MGFLAGLYTLLLVAICLLQALLLYRTGKPAARPEHFGTKFNTAVNGFYKSLDDTFKSFTLTAENGLDQIRAQSIGGSTAKGE